MSAGEQAKIFAFMMLCGVCIGIVYCFFYLCRFCFGFGKVSQPILDSLFALCACALFVLFCELFAQGQLRLFSFLSCAIGAALVILFVLPQVARTASFCKTLLQRVYTRLKATKLFAKLLK